MTRKSEKTWVFVHIPKTAGTTLARSISPTWFPDRRHVFSYAGFSAEEQVRRRQKLTERLNYEGIDFVGGHDVYGLLDHLPLKAQHFSFFRDPLERLVSLWFHHKHKPNPAPSWSWLIQHVGTFEFFAEAVNPMSEFLYSYMTQEENWAFDARLRERLPSDHIYSANQTIVRNLAMLTLPEHAPDIYEEMKQIALPRIDATIPLISERFEESVNYLAAIMGKRKTSYARQRPSLAAEGEREEALAVIEKARAKHTEASAFYQARIAHFEALLKAQPKSEA